MKARVRMVLAASLVLNVALSALAFPASRSYIKKLRPEPSHPSAVIIGDSIVEQADLAALLWRTDILNRGVGGDQAVRMPARFQVDVVDKHPRVVIIEGGVNDLRALIPVPQILAAKRELLLLCAREHIRPILMKTLYVARKVAVDPTLDTDAVNIEVTKLNAGIEALAKVHGVVVFDVNDVVSERGYLRDTMTRDGIHLSELGNMVLGAALRDVLQ